MSLWAWTHPLKTMKSAEASSKISGSDCGTAGLDKRHSLPKTASNRCLTISPWPLRHRLQVCLSCLSSPICSKLSLPGCLQNCLSWKENNQKSKEKIQRKLRDLLWTSSLQKTSPTRTGTHYPPLVVVAPGSPQWRSANVVKTTRNKNQSSLWLCSDCHQAKLHEICFCLISNTILKDMHLLNFLPPSMQPSLQPWMP